MASSGSLTGIRLILGKSVLLSAIRKKSLSVGSLLVLLNKMFLDLMALTSLRKHEHMNNYHSRISMWLAYPQ